VWLKTTLFEYLVQIKRGIGQAENRRLSMALILFNDVLHRLIGCRMQLV
jgi:hypothetical protein